MRRNIPQLIRLATALLLAAFLVAPEAFAPLFLPLTQNGSPPIYTQSSLLSLALSHLLLVLVAVTAATLVAVSLAVLVTRRSGAEFLALSRSLVNIGQTFPPVAVLALAVPALGFGNRPTLIALFLYGLLPIFENALTAFSSLPANVKEAARASGMTSWQRLMQVELPLAMPLIVGGIRLAAVISLGTATIGSTVAASTLGEVIIAGLLSDNLAFVAQGGLVVAVLAVLTHDMLSALERRMARRTGVQRQPA